MSSLEPTSPSPVPRGPRHAAPRTRRKIRLFPRSWWARSILALVLVVVLVVGGYAGYVWYQANRVHHIAVKGLSSASASKAGTENILLVGSTDRCALTVQNPAYGLCSQGVTGINSDVVMILHLDWNTGQISVLSIPRDTFVPNARSTGANKIDAALVQGANQLVAAIEQDFAIPIQHFVELNFDTFAGVVDALGGIKMYFPVAVHDTYSGLNQLQTGCVQLNGTQALQVVRARHLQYETATSGPNPANWPQENLSDLARIRRDHEFLRVLAAAVSKQGISNPLTDAKLISAVAPDLTVDSGLSTQDMISMIQKFKNVNPQTAPQLTLPVMTSTSYSYYYQGGNYGNVAFPVNTEDLATIQQFMGVNNSTNTLTNQPLPSPSQVSVAVMNGTSTSGLASSAASALQANGFKVTNVGNVTPVGNPALTTVTYNSLNPSVVAQAQTVWHDLSGQTILEYDPTQSAPVTLVLGTSYSILNLVPPATTTTAKATASTAHATTTTTVPVTTTTIPGFQAPNSAVSGLQPWDPRSCTPSGGEGP